MLIFTYLPENIIFPALITHMTWINWDAWLDDILIYKKQNLSGNDLQKTKNVGYR